MNKKVLIISYYWPPSGGAGVQRWLKFCKYLPEMGWDPIVLTVDPSVASYAQTDDSLAHEVDEQIKVVRTGTREIYGLYKTLFRKKDIPYGGFSNENKKSPMQELAKRIRGTFFIPDPRKGWNSYAYSAAKKLIAEHNIDTVVTTSPPHSTQLVGLKLKKNLGIRWVADLRDTWTDIYYYHEFKHPKWAKRLDLKYETQVLESADSVITVSNGFAEHFLRKMPVDTHHKLSVITNGYDEDDFGQVPEVDPKRFVITYTGTLAASYDITGFVAALKYLRADIRAALTIRFVGNVDGTSRALFEKAGLKDQVEYVGYVPHRTSVEYLLKGDVNLLIVPGDEQNQGMIPGKLFEYLRSEKPILCLGPKGIDAGVIVEEIEAGVNLLPNESERIGEFLTESFDRREAKVDNHRYEKYARSALTKRVAALLTK